MIDMNATPTMDSVSHLPVWLLNSLRDPETKELLKFSENRLTGSGGRVYPIIDGVPSLVYPPTLGGLDEKMNRLYRWLAPFYDLNERFFGRIFAGQDMLEGRSSIVDLLHLSHGIRLLEISPGPGVFQKLLRSAIGDNGELVSVDLSLPMLRQCQSIQHTTRALLVHANGAYLPFADETFDALFHFGGVNLFSEPERAVDEFVRVVKHGGIVAYGDEGFAEGYPESWRKKALSRMNPGFLRKRPSVPARLSSVVEHVVYGGLGYLVVGCRE